MLIYMVYSNLPIVVIIVTLYKRAPLILHCEGSSTISPTLASFPSYPSVFTFENRWKELNSEANQTRMSAIFIRVLTMIYPCDISP